MLYADTNWSAGRRSRACGKNSGERGKEKGADAPMDYQENNRHHLCLRDAREVSPKGRANRRRRSPRRTRVLTERLRISADSRGGRLDGGSGRFKLIRASAFLGDDPLDIDNPSYLGHRVAALE